MVLQSTSSEPHGLSLENAYTIDARILHALMKGQVVTDEVLSTLMTEVESILSSRPLVSVIFDPKNNVPLGNVTLLPELLDKRDCYARRRYAKAQYLADQFCRRWTREFLLSICHRQKWQQKQRKLCA